MSKKRKDYRKPRVVPGTIFDPARANEQGNHHRRMGFLMEHGVNPGAVAAGGVAVEATGAGAVRVYYDAIYLPDGEDVWPEGVTGSPVIPDGVWCDHGGYKKRHKVKQIRHFDAALSEVL